MTINTIKNKFSDYSDPENMSNLVDKFKLLADQWGFEYDDEFIECCRDPEFYFSAMLSLFKPA